MRLSQRFRLLSEKEAAKYLGFDLGCLRHARKGGFGPYWCENLKKGVVYEQSDLDHWRAQRSLINKGRHLHSMPNPKVDVPGFLKNLRVAEIPVLNVYSIYFLVKGDEIVYVGQTNSIYSRLRDHVKTKLFDSSFYFDVCPEDTQRVTTIETAFIRYLRPKLNGQGNSKGVLTDDQKYFLKKYGDKGWIESGELNGTFTDAQ